MASLQPGCAGRSIHGVSMRDRQVFSIGMGWVCTVVCLVPTSTEVNCNCLVVHTSNNAGRLTTHLLPPTTGDCIPYSQKPHAEAHHPPISIQRFNNHGLPMQIRLYVSYFSQRKQTHIWYLKWLFRTHMPIIKHDKIIVLFLISLDGAPWIRFIAWSAGSSTYCFQLFIRVSQHQKTVCNRLDCMHVMRLSSAVFCQWNLSRGSI